MTSKPTMKEVTAPQRPASPFGIYRDLQEHLRKLDESGLLITIDEPISKDSEMHPLVRWQFRGGIAEAQRKAFLFTHVMDAKGKRYDFPVAVGALAANADIYRIGMGVERLEDIGRNWTHALSNPTPLRVVSTARCQEHVVQGDALKTPGQALDALPIPISTPGFDAAPYLTAANVITKDPDNGIQNMGTYRACLRSPDRLGIMIGHGHGGREHWYKYKARGEKMPCALVLGCPPAVAYCGPLSVRQNFDELTVAGALVGQPIDAVRCRSVDLLVPADSEIVVEGLVETAFLEPEGPFGESHGHIALEEFNMCLQVTAITRRRKPVMLSIISQVTPSESSVIKRLAYEPMFLSHLRDQLGIRGVVKVSMHEPLTNLRKVIVLQMERGVPRTEIWRALYGTTAFQAECGKYVIAVNDDIDPANGDSLLWALSYRANPELDIRVLRSKGRGHGPRTDLRSDEDSALLIDATVKADMPPLALPKREHMEHAKALWERLGLPELRPEWPWHGYSLGNWRAEWDETARRAVEGDYIGNGQKSAERRRSDVEPNTPTRGK